MIILKTWKNSHIIPDLNIDDLDITTIIKCADPYFFSEEHILEVVVLLLVEFNKKYNQHGSNI